MNSTTPLYDNSTLVAKQEKFYSSSDDLNFTDVITNPFFYASSIIFIILLSSIITFIFILKNKPKLLFSTIL